MKTSNLFFVAFLVLLCAKLLKIVELNWFECFIPLIVYFGYAVILVPMGFAFVNFFVSRKNGKNKKNFDDLLAGKDLTV